MRRRQLLKFIGATSLATLSARTFGKTVPTTGDRLTLLRAVYAPTEAARHVGPHCCTADQSLEDLLVQAGVADATTTADVVRGFERQRERDFSQHNTELVNGWVLARAESAMIAILGQA